MAVTDKIKTKIIKLKKYCIFIFISYNILNSVARSFSALGTKPDICSAFLLYGEKTCKHERKG
ncbi:MAG: hypothetical protein K6G65_08895, partial [Lachnospiraceae bacterium]|nr:hypothetical protein [Lachnospiraceae bacterium]